MLLGPDKLDVVRWEVALPAVDGPKQPLAALLEDADSAALAQRQPLGCAS